MSAEEKEPNCPPMHVPIAADGHRAAVAPVEHAKGDTVRLERELRRDRNYVRAASEVRGCAPVGERPGECSPIQTV